MRHDDLPTEAPVGTPYGMPPPDPEPAPNGREPELTVEPEPEPELEPEPEPESAPAVATAAGDDDAGAALFGPDDVDRFRGRWRELQADFVDDPKQAVQGADELVGEVMLALSEIVAEHKRSLDGQWHSGAGETEDLRVALRRYRSFFDQLLDN